MAASRQVEAPTFFDRFYSGLNTNRNPLYTPKRIVGLSVVPQNDVLIDGLNMEITPQQTLARRPGYPTFCSQTFGSSEWPLGFYSCRLSGQLFNFVDTQVAVYTISGNTLTNIYTKTTTAPSRFQQIGDFLYWSDGTVNVKYGVVGISTTKGFAVTNNGVATPPNAPTVANLNFHDVSGHNQYPHAWSPNYAYAGPSSGVNTFWFEDQNGNVQFAFLTNNGIGSSANNAPKWGTAFGSASVDGSMTWYCAGSIGTWQASKGSDVYSYSIYDAQALPTLQAHSNGPSYPYDLTDASGVFSWTTDSLYDGKLRSAAAHNNSGNTNIIKFSGFNFNLPAGAVITGIFVNLLRVGYYENSATDSVVDYTVQLMKGGSLVGSNKALSGKWPSWHITHTAIWQGYGSSSDLWGTTWGPADINASNFGFALACTVASHSDSDSQPKLDGLTIDVYYQVSSISNAYFSSIILDSNGNLQRVKTLGTTGASQPTWATTVGSTTTDNTMTWECLGSGNVLAALVGWDYAQAFHTTSNHVSTTSPQLSLVAPIVGPNIPLTGFGSDDPSVDQVQIYRNYDGGSLLFYDASEPNVSSTTAWNHIDTAQDTDLDVQQIGPIADANDPPPAGMTLLAFFQGRNWGANGNNLQFTAGPDCTNGDPNQAWPPANVFQFPETINALIPTASGLLVYGISRLWIVLGGPQTLSFYVQPLMKNFGVLRPECVVEDGNTVYCYTTNRQLKSFSFTDYEEVGHAIADKIRTTFDPSLSCLEVHRNGEDEGLFISDGSANVYRMSILGGFWCPVAQPVGGIGLLKSIETSAGTYTLLAGSNVGSDVILGRSITSFVDRASSTYSGYSTFGSMVMSAPGQQPVSIGNFILESTTAGTAFGLSVLPNEISGSFTAIPFTTNDPPNLPASSTIRMRRHDWNAVQSMLPNWIKHMQVQVTMPSENAKNELLGLAINHVQQ